MHVLPKSRFIKNGILSAERKTHCGIGSVHSHDFFEIEYILDGTGVYTVNGTPYPLQAGMLFFMSPADTHSVATEGAEFYNVMFPCSFFDTDLLYSLFAPGTAAVLSLSEADRSVMNALFSELPEKEPQYARHFLRCILLKLSTLTQEQKTTPHSHIRAAIVYILEHFRNGITLQDTAAHLGLTEAYLSTLFLQEAGKNFKNYVDELRFDHAAKLLSSTELTVAEVCTASGFSDYANFSRRFRTQFGCTPSEYRKSL